MRDKGDLDEIYSRGQEDVQAAMAAFEAGGNPSEDMPEARRDEIERFVELEYVEKLLKLTPEATLTFVGDDVILDSPSKTTIAETFSVSHDDAEPFEVTLVLERNQYKDHGAWHVSLQ